jgi:hypothetical protein
MPELRPRTPTPVEASRRNGARSHGPLWEQANPLTTFGVRRFNAARGQQTRMGREIRNCLKLRRLRKAAPACTFEPEATGPDEQNARTIYRRERSNPMGGFETNPGARYGTSPTTRSRPTTTRPRRTCATNPEGKPASTNSAPTKFHLDARPNPER